MTNKGKKIFIADDEVDILDILKLMLQTHGYDVSITADPTVIFDWCKRELPDIILLDIWMSGLDGRDVCKQLKETPLTQNIPVIFISANSNITDIARECKADGYIAKPFEMSHLLDTIGNALQASTQSKLQE
ncbi:MAG: response regulator [Chitinophagaceae bacterium]|nr:MAG: response regulator [Chitinophagaceae bacterium]